MNDFLHYQLDLEADDAVEVTLNGKANVLLLDPENWERYRRGEQYLYHGGFAGESPAEIPAPHAGHWHLVVDLGGFPGSISAWLRVLKGAA